MSYSPTVYEKGDIVTAEKLNHIENALVDVNKQYVVLNFSYDINTHKITVINSITFAEAWDLMYNQNQLIFMRVIKTGESESTPIKSFKPSFQYGDITTDVISYMKNTRFLKALDSKFSYYIFGTTVRLDNSSDILIPFDLILEEEEGGGAT